MKARLTVVSPREAEVVAPRILAEDVAPTRTFTRRIETSAALPWRQRQMAELDARLGAPAPMEQLVCRLRRVQAWRPGQPGRFEADYLHLAAGAQTSGRTALPVSRLSAALLAASLLLLPIVALGYAWGQRQDQAEAISALEDRVTVETRRATAAARRADESRRLERLHMGETSPGQVLKDLDWVSLHRRSEVTLSAVHWAHGIVALEANSETSPLDGSDKPVQRAARPLRPGVWLWGVAVSPGGRTP